MKYSKDELIKMYKMMVLSRVYDQMIQDTADDGDIIGMHHLGFGQESIGAGIITALRDSDWFLPTHRMHAAHLHRCDLNTFAAEQFGKISGYNKGMACDFHLSNPDLKLIFPNGILGQHIPIATGFANALKMDKKDEIVMVCEGEGAFTEGVNYEALYMAAAMELPMVIIVEDNGYAISYPSKRNKANLSERAKGFGIPAVTVDGNDVLAVREAVDAAVAKARNNETCMVEMKTLRWFGHFTGDSQPWRDPEEIKLAKANDPIERFEKKLFALKALDEEAKSNMWKETEERVQAAKIYALECEYPGEAVVTDYTKLYANPWEV
jgi:TPP-dependent pyruvate/acetoin dehydrogenase alpha subunit